MLRVVAGVCYIFFLCIFSRSLSLSLFLLFSVMIKIFNSFHNAYFSSFMHVHHNKWERVTRSETIYFKYIYIPLIQTKINQLHFWYAAKNNVFPSLIFLAKCWFFHLFQFFCTILDDDNRFGVFFYSFVCSFIRDRAILYSMHLWFFALYLLRFDMTSFALYFFFSFEFCVFFYFLTLHKYFVCHYFRFEISFIMRYLRHVI